MESRIHREVYVRFGREYGTVEIDDRLCLPHEFITEGEMKMNKKDLIENIALNNPTLTKKSVDEIVNTIFDDMAEALSKGETVDIFGFGKFEVTERGERDGINPVTMEKIRIKASKNVKFRPSKSLKNKVN